jgi:hypothetical protein
VLKLGGELESPVISASGDEGVRLAGDVVTRRNLQRDQMARPSDANRQLRRQLERLGFGR